MMVILRERETPHLINLCFSGYYVDGKFPEKKHQGSGIYVVYTGNFLSKKSCTLEKMLYIGESKEAATRPDKNHEHYKDWLAHLKKGQQLFFSFADVKPMEREQAEAALIYHHRKVLPCNKKGTKSFDYPDTHIKVTGIFKFLNKEFIVSKTSDE